MARVVGNWRVLAGLVLAMLVLGWALPAQGEERPGREEATTVRVPEECVPVVAASGPSVSELDLPNASQKAALNKRLLGTPNHHVVDQDASLIVTPRPAADTVFMTRTTGSRLQVVGRTEQSGRMLSFGFDHKNSCGSAVRVLGSRTDVSLEIAIGQGEKLQFDIRPPWAIDAVGMKLPTWFESDGTTLRQIVDATSAVAPIVFDPTYDPISCEAYYSDLFDYEALSMYDAGFDIVYCSVRGMFYTKNRYDPILGWEDNVANEHGWVVVSSEDDAECSFYPDTGLFWDFQVPCKAHDYCYDLRKAGFSGTIPDEDCDLSLYWLAEAHCNDRGGTADLCRSQRNLLYNAVSSPGVVTDPDPGTVTIRNDQTAKCTTVEFGSPADGTPMQQWDCVPLAHQIFTIHPDPDEPGYFNIKPVAPSGKCAQELAFSLIVSYTCAPVEAQRFKIRGENFQETYTMRSKASFLTRCWQIPNNSFTNGEDINSTSCNPGSLWWRWSIVAYPPS